MAYRNKLTVMRHTTLIFLATTIGISLPGYCHSQEVLTTYGYSDLVFRDFGKREFPNGATENPPPTFGLLRTHVLMNSQLAEDWRAFLNLRFQSGADLGADEHEDKGEMQLLEVWFEYRHSQQLRIRGGQFLAPFGYFNTRKFQSLQLCGPAGDV